jgi:hypothetical protein
MDNRDHDRVSVELENLKRFESLLAELPARFVNLPAHEINLEIRESLRRIAETLDLGLIGLGGITPDSQDFFSTRPYAKPGTKPWLGDSRLAEGPPLDAYVHGRTAFHHARRGRIAVEGGDRPGRISPPRNQGRSGPSADRGQARVRRHRLCVGPAPQLAGIRGAEAPPHIPRQRPPMRPPPSWPNTSRRQAGSTLIR